MRSLLLAGMLALSTTAHAQQLELPPNPVNLTFLTASVEEVLSLISRLGGITIEFDASVTEEMQRARLAFQPLRFNGLMHDLLKLVTEQNGLTYTVTGPKAVRIAKSA